jgi:hypothetical protein
MRITKPVAILIGLATIWPLVYIFIFFAVIFGSFVAGTSPRAPGGTFESFQVLMVAHVGTMLISAGLLTFYIVHVFKNPALAGDRRTLWAVVLFLGNVIAMPIYWFLYVWREASRNVAHPSPSPPPARAV